MIADLAPASELREVARSQLERPDRPAAIFSPENSMSIGARSLDLDLDLELERVIAQVGLDHIELSDVVTLGITTVPQQTLTLGRREAAILFERIADDRSPATREVFTRETPERGSGEIRP